MKNPNRRYPPHRRYREDPVKYRKDGKLRTTPETKKPYTVSLAVRAANAKRPLKTGAHAKTMTREQVREALVEKIAPGASEILDNVFADAAETGNLRGVNLAGARALFETELIRRAMVKTIAVDGVLVDDDMIDRDGNVYGHRTKANPLLEHVTKMAEQLGFTAEQMQLTKKSRGEGLKDKALTDLLEHRAKLSALKAGMPPPRPALPEPIDVTPTR